MLIVVNCLHSRHNISSNWAGRQAVTLWGKVQTIEIFDRSRPQIETAGQAGEKI